MENRPNRTSSNGLIDSAMRRVERDKIPLRKAISYEMLGVRPEGRLADRANSNRRNDISHD